MTMKMRKFLAIMLTIVMAASMLCASALAAGDPTFRGAEIEAKAGETITYDIYIENNPGIVGYKVQVDFSDAAFDLATQSQDEMENTIEIKLGDFSKNASSKGNLVSNPTVYGCVAMWFNVDEVDTEGVAFSVTLKVADNAINGTHAVKIRCDSINTIDGDYNLVPFKTVDGSVTVTGGVDGTINNEDVGPSPEELQQMEEGTLSPNGNPVETKKPNANNEDEADSELEAGDKLEVEGEDGNDVDSPDADDTDDSDNEGMSTTALILIIVGAVAVVAVIILVAVKAKSKKGNANSADEKEMGIGEVMGWNDADEDDED